MLSILAICLIVFGSFLFSIFYMISIQPATMALRMGDKAFKICGQLRVVCMLFELLVLAGYVLFVFSDVYNFKIAAGDGLIIRIIGVIVAVITLLFMFIGVKAAGKEAMIPNKQTQLYKGIYKYMRHPQTLGEMLSWFGIAMILNSMTLFVYSAIFLPMFIGFTVIEDNDLSVRFGKEYIEYTKHTGIFWRKKKGKV